MVDSIALREQMIHTALELKYYRLISLCGGNVSVRLDDGNFLITPSGMEYDNMKPEDICKVNKEGAVIEGKWRASSDTAAILTSSRICLRSMPSSTPINPMQPPSAWWKMSFLPAV